MTRPTAGHVALRRGEQNHLRTVLHRRSRRHQAGGSGADHHDVSLFGTDDLVLGRNLRRHHERPRATVHLIVGKRRASRRLLARCAHRLLAGSPRRGCRRATGHKRARGPHDAGSHSPLQKIAAIHSLARFLRQSHTPPFLSCAMRFLAGPGKCSGAPRPHALARTRHILGNRQSRAYRPKAVFALGTAPIRFVWETPNWENHGFTPKSR